MEEGFLAKIIKGDGSKEIKVGEVLSLFGIRINCATNYASSFLNLFLSLLFKHGTR